MAKKNDREMHHARVKPALASDPAELQSLQEAAEDALEEFQRKREGEKFPFGPKVPISRRRGVSHAAQV